MTTFDEWNRTRPASPGGFVFRDVWNAAQLAMRERCEQACADVCEVTWNAYKRGDIGAGRADPYYEGASFGAEECEKAVSKLEPQ